jgi:hypothetical protein
MKEDEEQLTLMKNFIQEIKSEDTYTNNFTNSEILNIPLRKITKNISTKNIKRKPKIRKILSPPRKQYVEYYKNGTLQLKFNNINKIKKGKA